MIDKQRFLLKLDIKQASGYFFNEIVVCSAEFVLFLFNINKKHEQNQL